MLAMAVFLTLTYVLYRGTPNPTASKAIMVLIYIDILLLSLVSVFVWRQFRAIISLRYPRDNKHGFYRQVIVLFSCIAIIPSVCVFFFSILFFNIGIENLFKNPIKNVIENSEEITKIYIDDITNSLECSVNELGKQVESCINEFMIDEQRINSILADTINLKKTDISVIQIAGNDIVNTIAKTQFAVPADGMRFAENISSLENGDMLTFEDNSTIFSTLTVNRDLGVYILASIPIDFEILEHRDRIKKAVAEYSNLSSKRVGIQISFMTFFLNITLLLMLTAILVGIIFAKRVMQPVNNLIMAIDNISLDDINNPIKIKAPNNELSILVGKFNEMIVRITEQNKQIVITNKLNAWRDIARKMAHEIKNPLTPIQLSAERIKNKYQGEISSDPEIFNNCLETIIRQVRCIGNLVTEFSDFARMPEPKIEQIDIIKLMQQAIFIQSNAHKNIKFIQKYEYPELFCNVDAAQINQVMINLTQNAINSIIENNTSNTTFVGTILVTLRCNDGKIIISLEDDGIGFSDSAMKRALEPYYTTRKDGTGLGLAIVNKIMIDHSGKISLGQSKKLGGAMILLEIPLNSSKNRG